MSELGAVASVITIASAGAKLSIACIEFASNIGSAGSEIVAVGTEISQFCVVLKQIEATLTKAKKTVRYSLTAILAIESITQQCRPVFQEIENILNGLKKENKEPNFLSRLAWVLKRSKVQLLRKTLESSKLTLSCMLMTLLFAENIASRNESTVETRQEDEHQQAVTESLLLARECSVAELERLEEEDINGNESVWKENSGSSHARSLSTDAVSNTRTERRNNRRSAIMDGAFLPSVVDSRNAAGNRSSLLLNSVLLDDSSPIAQQLANLDISQKRNSQPVELLKRWTNEGNRLSKLVESPEDLHDSPKWESAEAVAIPGALEPSPGEKRETWATLSSRGGFELDVTPPSPPKDPLRGREALYSTQYRPLIIQGGDRMESFRLTKNSTADAVLRGALERYHHPTDWSKYDLFVEYGIHHRQWRRLGPREYPLRLLDQLYQEGKAPIFKLLESDYPVRIKEEQLRREEEKLREIEFKVQREINEKRQKLLARESQLKELEARLEREQNEQLTVKEDKADIFQLPENDHPVRGKEELLRREEEKLREIEFKVQREINEKRQILLARESQLKELEARLEREQNGQLPSLTVISQPSMTSSNQLAPIAASIPRYYYEDDAYGYIISAKMEDGRYWELRRYYQDFYDMQISLLDQFPVEAGLKGKPRTLPYMPGPVRYVTDAITRGRRENLDEYMKTLLQMPSHVSRSDLVRSMFVPREGDKEVLEIVSDL